MLSLHFKESRPQFASYRFLFIFLFILVFSRSSAGGLKLIDEGVVKAQRAAAWDVVKQIGRNVMDGRNLVNVTLPVTVFEARSMTHKLTDAWSALVMLRLIFFDFHQVLRSSVPESCM